MKRTYILSLTVIIVLFLTASGTTSLTAADDGFVPLFNDINLDGWVNVNGAPETYTVKDGMIVCSGIPNGVMRTTKQYENFILEIEYRHTKKGGNAGLFIHSDALPPVGKPFTRSVEIQVMDGNEGDIFSIQGATMVPDKPHPKGWTRSYPAEARTNPAGNWNHYRVESRSGMVSLAVNGKVVTKAYQVNPRKGYICIESEGSEIHFRNIRIRELPGSNPPADVTAKECEGFCQLYNGNDLREWKLPAGSEGHWIPEGHILSYDGKSEAEIKDLWTKEEFKNFTFIVDWRQPAEPKIDSVPIILPDGSYALDENGGQLKIPVMDAGDSGIYLRGSTKSQINIWNWPIGSGEIWGYRLDKSMPPSIKRGATPILNADNRTLGGWNRFEITVIDEWVTVILNGKTVIRECRLPGIPESGPIGLQHHGDPIQFANIYIKKLN
ncbi:DUF1080 domain-containing protein [bacterium]|nr:DUF1080 domain-containing protein [bacterium]